jgi:hypothetical protein
MRLSHLVVIVAAVGCATTGVRRVPEADWRSVPVAERDAIDRANAADQARAQHELALARTAAVDAHRLPTALPVARTVGDRDAAERAQLARIEAAKTEWARAGTVWRQDRLAAALTHIDVVSAEREAKRAEAIDTHLRGGDSYDIAEFRGQLARAQERYAVASEHATRSRLAFVRASADVASQKEAYAQLVRGRAPERSASERLELTGWTAAPGEGSRRRGLKIVSETTTYLRPPR